MQNKNKSNHIENESFREILDGLHNAFKIRNKEKRNQLLDRYLEKLQGKTIGYIKNSQIPIEGKDAEDIWQEFCAKRIAKGSLMKLLLKSKISVSVFFRHLRLAILDIRKHENPAYRNLHTQVDRLFKSKKIIKQHIFKSKYGLDEEWSLNSILHPYPEIPETQFIELASSNCFRQMPNSNQIIKQKTLIRPVIEILEKTKCWLTPKLLTSIIFKQTNIRECFSGCSFKRLDDPKVYEEASLQECLQDKSLMFRKVGEKYDLTPKRLRSLLEELKNIKESKNAEN